MRPDHSVRLRSLFQASEVAEPHHGGLAPDTLERQQVCVIAHATRRHDRDAARAGRFVEREVGPLHGAVSIDRGDVKSSDPSHTTPFERVVKGDPRALEPAPHREVSVAHVKCCEQLSTERIGIPLCGIFFAPQRRADDHAFSTRLECESGGVDAANAARYLEGNRTGRLSAAFDHRRTQSAIARPFKVDHVNEIRACIDESRHELFDRLAKDHSVVVASLEANRVVAEKVEGRDELHSSEVA